MSNIKQYSLKKNFVFQVIYQIVILIIPLFVAPYLTRTLGDTSLGIYSYTYSIVGYFALIIPLGIYHYGQRIIATKKNDSEKLRRTFWSLFCLNLITSFIIIFIYIIFTFCFGNEYKTIYFIQIMYLISISCDITWLFRGLENFKSVVIKNLIIKVLECICIFIFVKHSNDLIKYTLIMATSACLSQIILIPQAIHSIPPIKFNLNDVKEHIKPMLLLFIPAIANSLYTIFDKTLLGVLSTKENVAYYEYSNKIINIPITINTVINTVIFPRACICIENNDMKNFKKYINYSLQLSSFISMGCIFGLIGIGKLFATLYYGEAFSECGNVIIALSSVIYIISIGNIIRTQYIIPFKKDKLLTKIYIINTIINLLVTWVLIPKIGIYGAVIGTLSAEICGLVLQMIACRKVITIKDLLISSFPYLIFGLFMFFILKLMHGFISPNWVGLLIQIFVGLILYCILCGIYILLLSPIKNDVKSLIFRKNR